VSEVQGTSPYLHNNNREKKPIQKSPQNNDKQEKVASLNADHGPSSTTNVVPVMDVINRVINHVAMDKCGVVQ